jgi:argininosuccinate lyase
MKKRKAVWGGRFKDGPTASLRAIGDSLRFDKRLARFDVMASIAHARMLGKQRIIPKRDADAIVAELKRMLGQIHGGSLVVEGDDEDVHSWIERTLTERIGDAGRRVHTARSRNDQVATAFRQWTRHQCVALHDELNSLMRALTTQAAATTDVIVPAYTHLQRGQPTLLSHHLLAYVEMFDRDVVRSMNAMMSATASCPLGSGAATGVPYPVDRASVAADHTIAFEGPAANSMDAVSDRDFAAEFLFALSLTAVHLSRLAEDVCLWASSEFGLLELGDSVSTGSSIMPQKRNPDAAELVRAKTGRMTGALVALLTVMKGLPLAYAKDMQEDKEPVFDAAGAWALSLAATAGMVRDMTPDVAQMRSFAGSGFATATDLADWLVPVLRLPFRAAHQVTGRLVALAEARGVDLASLSLAEMQSVEAGITDDVYSVLTVEASVASRTSYGGTAPANVAAQAARWLETLA